ncbi:hypothetical protein O988_04937, partial [Pseudogymnoascus sp. VKM F-3808]
MVALLASNAVLSATRKSPL